MIKNIEAAKQLIDKYQDFIDNQRLNYQPRTKLFRKTLQEFTGFSDTDTCTLCRAVGLKEVKKPKIIKECRSCIWYSTYQGKDKDGFCLGNSYTDIYDANPFDEEFIEDAMDKFYNLLKERIELLKEAIEASEELNKEEDND